MTPGRFPAADYLHVIRNVAAKMQEFGDMPEQMPARLEALAVDLATRSAAQHGDGRLVRQVAAELRRYIEEQDTIAARTPALAQQPGWDARMMFLRDAVEAIEARGSGSIKAI